MGNLYIVSTPIGNLEDVTIRAIKTLFSVDYIACEDTRKTGQLLAHLYKFYSHYNIYNRTPQFISYYDEIEFKRIPELIELLQNDKNIALVSDSGTPLISDPGFKLVGECIKRNIRIISIPGSTSLMAALTVSGLPTDQFLFLGYLPSKKQKRINLLEKLHQIVIPSERSESRNLSTGLSSYTREIPRQTRDDIHPTIIFFESPHRIKECLDDLKEVFGNIDIVICRELTKIHEETWRGKMSETVTKEFKGEVVILLSLRV